MSETASPTYLSPTSRPSKRPRFTAFDESKSWNKFNGFTYLITQPDPSTTKNKTFYLSLSEIRFKQIKITKMNNMGNNIFTSKMRRNKLFFLLFKCIKSSFSAQSSFSLQHFYEQLVHRDQMLTYFYCDIFFHKHFWSKKLNRERDSLQVKFNVSDEVSYRSEWFQCFRRNSQNGFRVYRPNYTNL